MTPTDPTTVAKHLKVFTQSDGQVLQFLNASKINLRCYCLRPVFPDTQKLATLTLPVKIRAEVEQIDLWRILVSRKFTCR